MKTKKAFALFLVAVLVIAMTASSFAASIGIVEITDEGSDAGRFVFDGKDIYQSPLKTAKYLVIDAVSATDANIEIILQSDSNAWDQQPATRVEGTDTWYVDMSAYEQSHFADSETWFKIVVTDWSSDGSLKLNKMETSDAIPVASAPVAEPVPAAVAPTAAETATVNPKTGDNDFLLIAILLLTLSSAGIVVFRKIATEK